MLSDVTYQNALTKRATLVQELERVDSFLALYREFGSGDPSASSRSAPVARPAPKASSNGAPKGAQRASRGTGARMLDVAEEVLREAGEPMSRVDLLKAIQARGVPVGGKDPGATLASGLWRERHRFESIRGLGYTLRRENQNDDDDFFEDASTQPYDEAST